MILTHFVLIGSLLITTGKCDFFSDLEHGPDPFGANTWNWQSSWPALRRSDDDTETASSEKREPLSPNYQDPVTNPSEVKPALAKPSYNPSVLPGGVLDVDASGNGFAGLGSLGGFPEIHGNFGFGIGHPSRNPTNPENGPPGGLFGLGGFFGSIADYKPWWKGENVCIEREESTDDDDEDAVKSETEKNETESERNFFSTSISLSNCQQTPVKYECVTKINNHGLVKTFTVRYKCCYGYERVDGSSGCTRKIDLKDLSETIENLNGKEFKKMIQDIGYASKLVDDNYTIFLPTDDVLAEFEDKMNDMNMVAVARRRRDAVSTIELVKNHFVPGFVDLHDITNEEIINTDNGNKGIRINVYPTRTFEKMVTANCVPVKKSNNLATNGIVHVIAGVMKPASSSIKDIIREHPRLTSLRQVLDNTNISAYFEQDGHYTVFAPTDEAFNQLDEASKSKLLRGNACASNILKHHIVSNTICAAAITGNATTHNIAGDVLNMERSDENVLTIEGKSKIEKTDIIATNGVIHLIDKLILPDTSLYLNEALKNYNLTKFQELVKEADFEEDLNNFDNATVFAPSNEALSTPEAEKYLTEIRADKEKLREFIKFHTVKGELETSNMENNAMLETEDDGKLLRINLYSTLPLFANIVNRATANCARITNFDKKSCGSTIHEVDRILKPADKTIYEIITESENFNTLKKIMEGTDIAEILKDINRTITFVAPDDEAFKNIDNADLKTLMDDKEKATTVLKNHILTEVLCCAGVGPQTFGFNSYVPTLTGQHQQVSRSGTRQVRIGRSSVTECDSTAINGVVHKINRVLFPQRPTNHFGFFLFDL